MCFQKNLNASSTMICICIHLYIYTLLYSIIIAHTHTTHTIQLQGCNLTLLDPVKVCCVSCVCMRVYSYLYALNNDMIFVVLVFFRSSLALGGGESEHDERTGATRGRGRREHDDDDGATRGAERTMGDQSDP